MVNTDMQDEQTPTRVMDDLCQLDRIFTDTYDKRKALEIKLESIVNTMTIDPNIAINARLTEVQMQVISTYRSLLIDHEKSISLRVSSKLKHEEAQSSSKHSAAVAEFLAKFNGEHYRPNQPGVPMDPAQTEIALERAFAESGLEPVMDTELKTDPNDVRI